MGKKVTIRRSTGRVTSRLSLREYPLVRFPFRFLIAVGVLLVMVTGFFVLRNMSRDEDRLYEEMKSRADVLIWALEGGARSLRPGQAVPPPPPRAFVEEMASQPYILFVAILDENGRAVAHSDPERNGEQLYDKSELAALAESSLSTGSLVSDRGEQRYDVIKAFTPAVRHFKRRLGMGMMGRGPGPMWQHHNQTEQTVEQKQFYILVSIDPEPFLAGLRQHTWHILVISSLLALSGITGVALLIFIRNYKTSKKLLEDTQTLALQVFDKLPIGVFTTDETGNITLFNRACSDILGFGGGRLPHVSAYPWFDWRYFTRSVDSGFPVIEDEYEFSEKSGKRVTVGVSATVLALEDPDLEAREYLFIIRDLGEVKQLQKQVRLNERLTALGNLAAGVAHEIRNPLSTVKGYATFLAGKLKGTQEHTTAELMLEEVERLNRVVSDLLNMAKQGKFTLSAALVEPVLAKAVRLAGPEAESKGVTLENNATGRHAAKLDEDKLLQALLNLLINAIHATEAGGKVRLFTDKREDAVTITIQDEGHGMDAGTQARIFSPYFTTKPSGTGLGLTITHQIIEQHGGQIRVQSEPGKGSVFMVLLPEAKEQDGE